MRAEEILANKAARDALELIESESLQIADPATRDAFWVRLRELVGCKTTPPVRAARAARLEPMSDEEARAFERRAVPLGKHWGRETGVAYDDDPGWFRLVACGEYFEDLRRYVAFRERVDDILPDFMLGDMGETEVS